MHLMGLSGTEERKPHVNQTNMQTREDATLGSKLDGYLRNIGYTLILTRQLCCSRY